MADIYAVRSMATNKVVQSGFEKKADAKAHRNELCKEEWAKWSKKAEKDRGPKPFPFTITRGTEHPYWLS
tara:strand:+ start:1225 stop:1434 length:210 start_codon:yes stop_codon:yes gene_type:complete